MAPENSASVAAPPALNRAVLRSTSGPSLSAKIPFSTPAMAAAWVTLGKYPSRSVTCSAFLAVVVVVGATGAVEAVTAPALLADLSELDPEPHAAPARVRASRPATRPVRNGR